MRDRAGASPDRAVAVVVDAGRLLVMRRVKQGHRYCVLPGGGVEDGEDPRHACLRELREETGLDGTVIRFLGRIDHEQRVGHYFLVEADATVPLRLGGPEAEVHSADNHYLPAWVPLADLPAENLQPMPVRGLIARVSS